MTSQFAPSYGGARRGLHSSKHAKIMGILVVEDAEKWRNIETTRLQQTCSSTDRCQNLLHPRVMLLILLPEFSANGEKGRNPGSPIRNLPRGWG